MKDNVIVIILGGSLVVPNNIDVEFVRKFHAMILKCIQDKLYCVLVLGGGNTARSYQQAYKNYFSDLASAQESQEFQDAQDRIGIAATHLNARLIHEIFYEHAEEEIITDPDAQDIAFKKNICIAAGWKPGFSTDFIGVRLAVRYRARRVINLSNIERIYTEDPKTNETASPLDAITWKGLLAMSGTVWKPGLHVPFDPIAAQEACDANLEIITALGSNVANAYNIIQGKEFVGTRIYNS